VIRAIQILVGATLVLALAARAHAYPQFSLSRGQTCIECHLAPAGGGLLNENGENVAGNLGKWDTTPSFLYGKVPLPTWLSAGGDFRGVVGYMHEPQGASALFPMQGDLYGDAIYNRFGDTSVGVHVTAGFRPAQWRNEAATYFWSREHYLTLREMFGDDAAYVRVGRFMPVFGLRLAEHEDYTRRYGGTQLYSETYGASASYIAASWELHVSGFIKDPVIDTVEDYHGGAIYSERRFGTRAAVGGEVMFKQDSLDTYDRYGMTGKYLIESPGILIQTEVQVARHIVNGVSATNQIVGYALGTWMATDSVMVDVGAGYFNEDAHVKDLYRDAFDVNVHWFVESHTELVLNTRLETLAFGSGGPTGAYALLQAHYRL